MAKHVCFFEAIVLRAVAARAARAVAAAVAAVAARAAAAAARGGEGGYYSRATVDRVEVVREVVRR